MSSRRLERDRRAREAFAASNIPVVNQAVPEPNHVVGGMRRSQGAFNLTDINENEVLERIIPDLEGMRSEVTRRPQRRVRQTLVEPTQEALEAEEAVNIAEGIVPRGYEPSPQYENPPNGDFPPEYPEFIPQWGNHVVMRRTLTPVQEDRNRRMGVYAGYLGDVGRRSRELGTRRADYDSIEDRNLHLRGLAFRNEMGNNANTQPTARDLDEAYME